jgi:hypothetical protein
MSLHQASDYHHMRYTSRNPKSDHEAESAWPNLRRRLKIKETGQLAGLVEFAALQSMYS